MACERYRHLMMAFLDGEITEEDERELEEHLTGCEDCAREMEGFRRLEARMSNIRLIEPTDREWQRFWAQLYNRLERRLAWIFLVAGAVVTLGFGGFEFLRSETPLILKLGVGSMIAGGLLLFVSILRGRLHVRKVDRYRGIQR